MAMTPPHLNDATIGGTRTKSTMGEEMVATADRATRPQCRARGARPEHFDKALEAPCPFHGGQAKHLLKDCATMKGYIRGTLSQQGKAQKPTLKAGDSTRVAQEDDTEFPKAERCLMIFGGSHTYESR